MPPHPDDRLELLDRIATAAKMGQGLDAADTAAIAATMGAALGGGRSWLKLNALTRAAWRSREMKACALRLWLGLAAESRRGFARRLHRKLVFYRASTSYVSDAGGTTRPTGARWYMFRLLTAAGRVPSLTTLRGLLPPAGQPGPLFSGQDLAFKSQRDANQLHQR